MLEIKSTKKEIKINEKVFSMRSPTYRDSMEYEKKLKECGDDPEKKTECLFEYLEKLGLPKESAQDLEISHVVAIVNYLSDEKKS